MASIDAIEEIGHKQATKLRKARVRTTEALLKVAGTSKGRKELAAATGLDADLILRWVHRADLMRVKGVGEEYSELLSSAGVDTVGQLRNRNAANLLEAMIEINQRKRMVRRLPTVAMVEAWLTDAKALERVVIS